MDPAHSTAELWNPAPVGIFIAGERPEYLRHALLPEAPKARAVRLTMRGEIRLKRWRPFHAREVIDCDRGYVWEAKVSGGLSGVDALVDGAASCRWKWMKILPVMRSSGPEVTRSAIGRWLVESIWLPTMMRPDEGAVWEESSVTLSRGGETCRLDLEFGEDGGLRAFRTRRWGNPDGGPYRYHPFGGIVEEERRFGAVRLPSRIRAGWGFGTPSFDEGEFFRTEVLDAQFR